jgi:hypothetical protein
MLPNQIPAADPEIVALGSAINDVVMAAKATGSTALGDAEAALPDLVQAFGNIANVGVDIQKPANWAFIVYSLGLAFAPAAASASAAAAKSAAKK